MVGGEGFVRICNAGGHVTDLLGVFGLLHCRFDGIGRIITVKVFSRGEAMYRMRGHALVIQFGVSFILDGLCVSWL